MKLSSKRTAVAAVNRETATFGAWIGCLGFEVSQKLCSHFTLATASVALEEEISYFITHGIPIKIAKDTTPATLPSRKKKCPG